jgi:hypothetical protein
MKPQSKRASITSGLLAAITLSSTIATAQGRPDFSGLWRPVDSASTPLPPPQPGGPPPQPGGPPPPPKTISTTISQSAIELKMDRRVGLDGRETVHTFIYKLDGTESVNQMGPLLFRTKAAWDGAALVLISVVSAGGQPIGESRDVYRLENGDLIVETSRKTPTVTFTEKSVNRKD